MEVDSDGWRGDFGACAPMADETNFSIVMGESERAVLRIDPADDLIVALRDLRAGEEVDVDGRAVRISEAVAAKHKFCDRELAAGDRVKMYGVTVGETTRAVPAGTPLHRENLVHRSEDYGRKGTGAVGWETPSVEAWRGRTFDGYVRAGGGVGTANLWIVVPMVFCENRNLMAMRDALLRPLGYGEESPYEDYVRGLRARFEGGDGDLEGVEMGSGGGRFGGRLFPNVDGVRFLMHNLGCGGTRGDSGDLCGLLAGYICHPNVAGATVLSLGCQNAEVRELEAEIAWRMPDFRKPMEVFEQQKSDSERDLMGRALRSAFRGMAAANGLVREPCALSELRLGVECGASDGFSGISANPVIGRVSDLVVALGGISTLAEFPELCGVEQELVNRCVSGEVAEGFIGLMRRYERWAEAVGSALHMNPSPGNIADGLITDAIKSAGAAKKGGTSPIVEVVDYPKTVTKRGLSLLCTPGNDVESTTALAGAGSNLILFSTGMGTPTGNAVAPVVKISSNSEVARRHRDMIDFDAGEVITGKRTVEEVGEELLGYVIEVASGKRTTCAGRLGQDDFLPWKRGVSL